MRVPAWKPLLAAGTLVLGQAVVATGPAVAVTSPPTITADMPSEVPAGHNWAFNDFFPRSLRVAQGETIQFVTEGFHTATLLPKGVSPKQDMLTNGVATADAEDTTPNPGGQSHTAINIPALLPTSFTCGTPTSPCTFDGTSVVSSGAPAPTGPPPGPFAVTITATPGTYQFHCRIHPGMTGQITVLPAGSRGTSAEDVQEQVHAQVQADVKGGYAAEQAASHPKVTRNEDGTRTWWLKAGASGAGGHTAVLEFLPQKITIKRGDKVAWTSPEPNEPHTVTFPTDIGTDQVPLCEAGSMDTPFTGLCPGGSPGQPDEVEFAPGNGVNHIKSPATISDSGLLASHRELAAFGLPSTAALRSWTVSFHEAAAGAYTYVCQIHGAAMNGTITVSN